MVANNSDFYQIGASLSSNAQSYVQRLADEKFYQNLRAGKFCYVLNSRQMGKSSLRVRTMQRLEAEGTVCAAIDLTGIGKHKVTISQWYGGIVYALVESCQLEEKFDFDWQLWWQEHQNILDPVKCFSLFIEQVLLQKIQQPIVIFVDEIDRVLSQDFSLDDFFALIRFFQNQRVDKPIFERLTFALLGVATPSDLITDKTQTPFNIGEEIELYGFQLDEIQPLIKGLQGRFDNPQRVIEEILDWTGGQPFLTQKLCKLMVEESFKDNPCTVTELVRAKIIDNWESLDNPEHLRTIRNRICSNDQRASYLLELYHQIRQSGELASNNSTEVSELQLSGLVVKRQDKLKVYNQIYYEIFDSSWIENQLKNLRPYSENFRFWVASGSTEDSWLLRGKALQSAEEWARDKNLSYQDKQYLAASKEKEIQEKIAAQEKEAALERETKDRESAEARNFLLAQANKKAQQRIRNGSIFLIITSFMTLFLGILAVDFKKQIDTSQELLQPAGELSNLLKKNEFNQNNNRNESPPKEKNTIKISDYHLKIALLNLALASSYLEKVEAYLEKANEYLNKSKIENDSIERIQIYILYLIAEGKLSNERQDKGNQINYYQKAYGMIQQQKKRMFSENVNILFKETVESLYKEIILLAKEIDDLDYKRKVETSLKEYYYTELENQLKSNALPQSDEITTKLVLYFTGLEKDKLDEVSINKLQSYCSDLKKIDKLWNKYTEKRYSFSSQKEWAKSYQLKLSKGNIMPKWDIFSIFVPPAIAGSQPRPEYPNLGLESSPALESIQLKFLSACPFEIDLAEDGLVFDPPSNIRIRPDINYEIKCSIKSQEIIRIYKNFNATWYYTDACNGGWINKIQVRLKTDQ
ncbi:AAA-like domain-containing protein [Nostocales cyanobacterium LEGE 12452]|nr:AAA-like domain-containing protein [Nostocales cyanobacterium LEGE 12452]